MNHEIHLKVVGILMVALSIMHVPFPIYFKWQEELKSLSLINRQMMYVHTFFIGLIVLLLGILCLTSAHDLISTQLGKRVCLGIGVFWLARLAIQFFGYSSELWKGKKFETWMHVFFSLLWFYFSAVFIGTAVGD